MRKSTNDFIANMLVFAGLTSMLLVPLNIAMADEPESSPLCGNAYLCDGGCDSVASVKGTSNGAPCGPPPVGWLIGGGCISNGNPVGCNTGCACITRGTPTTWYCSCDT